MLRFSQPILALFIGLSMTVYGVHHLAVHVPPGDSLQQFWNALPAFGRVLLFLLGLAVTAVGLALLSTGVRGMRRGQRIKQFYSRPMDPDDAEEQGYPPGYGYR
jgi:hypothetical protein